MPNENEINGPRNVRIAVISDIHFSDESSRPAQKSFEKLIDSLKHQEFKYLIVNGDIVEDGSKTAHYNIAKTQFKNLIKEKPNLKGNIYFTSGNHDIDIDKLNLFEKKFFAPVKDSDGNISYRASYTAKNNFLTHDGLDLNKSNKGSLKDFALAYLLIRISKS